MRIALMAAAIFLSMIVVSLLALTSLRALAGSGGVTVGGSISSSLAGLVVVTPTGSIVVTPTGSQVTLP